MHIGILVLFAPYTSNKGDSPMADLEQMVFNLVAKTAKVVALYNEFAVVENRLLAQLNSKPKTASESNVQTAISLVENGEIAFMSLKLLNQMSDYVRNNLHSSEEAYQLLHAGYDIIIREAELAISKAKQLLDQLQEL